MTDGRKRTARVLATLCITAVSGSMLVAAPTYAEPDIDTVQTRVDKLYQQAEQASERYNDARLELKQAADRLSALQADLGRQQTKVDDVREQVASAVVRSTRARRSPRRPRCCSPRTPTRSSTSSPRSRRTTTSRAR